MLVCAIWRTMAEGLQEADRFKTEFKRYKKRDADFSDVIDFTTLQQCGTELRLHCSSTDGCSHEAAALGLSPPSQWKLYTLHSTPGLVVIPDPFLAGHQHHWVRRCLVDYPCRPNVCNLDAHVKREGEGQLWPEGDKGTLQLRKEDLLYKLRWVTLGYHYDWNTKEYSDDQRSPFPTDLGRLSSFILKVAGFAEFTAEAAIVNYYHLDSTLSGHTDHSERDLSLPLLSISFGQSAVFLIGGETKSVRPSALLLRSGDIVIMSGPSRTVFHGVPKVVSPSADTLAPETLSRRILAECIRKTEHREGDRQASSACHTCGTQSNGVGPATSKDLDSCREEVDPTTAGVATPSRDEEHEQTTAAGRRDGMAADNESELNCSSCATSEEDKYCESPAKRPRRAIECDADSGSTLSSCSHCAELLHGWPDFESYLSVSRINVNIRQVNSHI